MALIFTRSPGSHCLRQNSTSASSGIGFGIQYSVASMQMASLITDYFGERVAGFFSDSDFSSEESSFSTGGSAAVLR